MNSARETSVAPCAVPTISPREARAKVQAGALLLDVRSYLEWRSGHIAGATLVPLEALRRSPARGALGDEVLVICQSGRRSQMATQILSESGVNAVHVAGGLNAWQADGLPSQRADGEGFELERQIRIAAGALVLTGLLVPRARAVLFRRRGLGRDGFSQLVRIGFSAGQNAVESRARRRTRAQFKIKGQKRLASATPATS